jgi:hypothetical protein
MCRVPKTMDTLNQRLRKTKRYLQTRRAKVTDETPRLRSDSYEARSTERLDYVPTRTRHPRQDASTAFRLARGSLDKASRLSGNLRLVRPRVGPLDPPRSPTLRQKSEHLMRLPTTSNHHDYSSNQRGSSTGVKSYFLLPIPGWEVKTCHCTHHTAHYFATDHPRGRIQQGPYPTISGIRPYPPVLDPSSIWPRPSLNLPSVSREKRSMWHGARGLFTVSSSTLPWCLGMAGHSQGTSPQPPPQGSTKLHLRTPLASQPPLTL